MNDGLGAAHSPDFVAAWRSTLCSVYRWRQEGPFAVVPSIFGAPVFACVPGLNYTDLGAAEAREVAREMRGRSFNIRLLNSPPGEPPPGTPAVLRLSLRAFGHDREAVWERALKSAKRRGVRRARKAGLRVGEETGPGAVRVFRELLSVGLARHGAPVMPAALFHALVETLDARILVVRDAGGEARAGLLWLRDGPLAWLPWMGSRPGPDKPGDLLCWGLIERALAGGADILDFGRSPTGGGVDQFKRSFGAVPVPVRWLSNRPFDHYRRYAPVQKLWRALPRTVTDRLGPRLCRRLADY